MRRREFLGALGGAAATWPLAAGAQQAGKLPTIGYLGANTPSAESQRIAAFVQRLRELGWIEGRTIAIEDRWAEGRTERFAEIAAEFVRLKVDVIVTAGTAAVLAAKQATSVIPIVFAVAGDPVGTGLVAAGATGRQRHRPVDPGDRSCRQAARTLARGCPRSPPVGDLANAGNPVAVLEMREVQATARTLGLEVATPKSGERRISRPPSTRSRARGGTLCLADPLVTTNRIRINTLALGARLPTMYSGRGRTLKQEV